MKLRWSNQKDFDVTFEANDTESFTENGLSALRSFRISRERRVHRGEIHKTVSWCEPGYLHIWDAERSTWYNPGEIRETSKGISFFEPHSVLADFAEGESLDDIKNRDVTWFTEQASKLWQWCYDTWAWGNALNLTVMQVGDELQKEIDRSQAAAALGSIRTPKKAATSAANGKSPVKPGSRPRGRPKP